MRGQSAWAKLMQVERKTKKTMQRFLFITRLIIKHCYCAIC